MIRGPANNIRNNQSLNNFQILLLINKIEHYKLTKARATTLTEALWLKDRFDFPEFLVEERFFSDL